MSMPLMLILEYLKNVLYAMKFYFVPILYLPLVIWTLNLIANLYLLPH